MFSFWKRSIRRGFVQDDEEKCKNDARIGRKTCIILHQSYILHLILHPILHPKSSVNTGQLIMWCRKCRRFSKNFFCGGRGIAVRKMQNNSVRKLQNIGLLWAKVRMFASKKSDVFVFRKGWIGEPDDQWQGGAKVNLSIMWAIQIVPIFIIYR